jgi:predicted nuclease of predicted toxin-antitoxin system
MIKILLDQGLPRSTAEILCDEGWDVIHVGEIGLSEASDMEILPYARKENRIVITLDTDFHAILAVKNAFGPSVIRFRLEGLKGKELSHLIKQIWPRIGNAIKRGAMVTVTQKSIQIRKLPIISIH